MVSTLPGETLRVLLISANENMKDEIGKILKTRGGDQRLYWVSQADLAFMRAQDLLPHVILVDEDLGGANESTLISQLATRISSAALIALVREDAIETARQVVLAGARGFITKPLQSDDFLATLRQVLATRLAPHAGVEAAENIEGRIIVFCAPKGGTGRTTLALNLAIIMREIGDLPVVLVDADYAAPAMDVIMNLQTELNVNDLLARLPRLDEELISSVLATHTSGIRVLCAPSPDAQATPISLPQVQQILSFLKRMFSWVIVDLGLPLDEKAFAFLDGSDRIVLTVLPEMMGLRNTRLMMRQLRDRGYPPDKAWLILNRDGMRNGISPADIEKHLQLSIKYRLPDDQPLATYSINRGVPLVISHKHSAVARAIQGLAEMLTAELPAARSPAQMETKMSPLMRRLLRSTPTANS